MFGSWPPREIASHKCEGRQHIPAVWRSILAQIFRLLLFFQLLADSA